MAEARHGIRITEPLNKVMRKVFDSGHGLTELGLATLGDAVRAIDNVISHINESTAFFPEQPSLLARLHEIETQLDAEIARDAIDTSASAVVPALCGERRTVPGAPRRPPTAEEFDHEIANIYSEEATELLEAAETSLTAWNRDRKDKERVAELQRQLHTLKGGARMAGISAMGDLSHELETLVIQIDSGSVSGDDHAHAVMQASLDELARMRDLVSSGTLPAGAKALIAQIRELATPGRSTGVAAAPAAVAPAAAAAPPAAARPVTAAPPAAAPKPAAAPPRHRGIARPDGLRRTVGTARRPRRERGFGGEPRTFQRPGVARTRERSGGTRGNGARRRGPARHHAEQCRRGEHLPRPPRSAGQFDRLQSGGVGAHGDPPQGAAARPGDRDRSAGAQSSSGRGTAARRLRSARAGSILVAAAVLACARRNVG